MDKTPIFTTFILQISKKMVFKSLFFIAFTNNLNPGSPCETKNFYLEFHRPIGTFHLLNLDLTHKMFMSIHVVIIILCILTMFIELFY